MFLFCRMYRFIGDIVANPSHILQNISEIFFTLQPLFLFEESGGWIPVKLLRDTTDTTLFPSD